MNISSITFSREGEIISSQGSFLTDIEQIRTIIEDPAIILDNYGIQIGRTIDDKHYTVTAWRPYQQIILNDLLTIQTAEKTEQIKTDRFWIPVLDTINSTKVLFTNLHSEVSNKLQSFLGYYGYLSYEISRLIEIYETRSDTPTYPYLILDLPTRYIISHENETYYIEIDLPTIASSDIKLSLSSDLIPSTITHQTSYQSYIKDLKHIIDHIEQGDIYQANYTQQFQLQMPDDLSGIQLYLDIKTKQQLPHAAFLNYGNFEVLSLSPELFLRINHGHVITKPIKGTRPRGRTKEEDLRFIDELLDSTKDQAELAMIVDLLRNDLGKSALPGTVEVADHAVIETYENVHHLVSTVVADLEPSLEASWKLLLRAFPGGSISGVPKIRALEIIEEHEKVPRGIYTGNIGFIGLNGDLDFNIAIRTAIIMGNHVNFNAGGGIVYDSDPVDEYIESLHKAKHLANYFKHSFIGHLGWYNGSFIEMETIDPTPRSDGIFETILVDNGVIQQFDQHLTRFKKGFQHYEFDFDLIPTKEEISQLLRLNLATSGLIRLNLYAWRAPNGVHVHAKVQSYDRPSSPVKLYLSSDSFTVPSPVQMGLKSLDYDKYRQATKQAIAHNAWDSLLYDNNGHFLEGGRSTIFFHTDKWITPSQNVVKGTTRQHYIDNNVVEPTTISREELDNVSSIAIANALIGVLRVNSIIDGDKVVWKETDGSAFEYLANQ